MNLIGFKRLLVFGIFGSVASACTSGGGSDGGVDTPTNLDPPTLGEEPDRWQPQVGASWWWQIENTSELDVDLEVDVFDVDLFEGEESGKIAELVGAGSRVVCYFSAGTYEPNRPDAASFTDDAVISGSNLPQFSEELWLNIGNADALENVIKAIMRARLDLAEASGCDAVEPDNVDGHENDETFGMISASDQLNYNSWIATEAHERGLSVGLKNDLSQVETLSEIFDFAINEQCYGFGNQCAVYETTFLAADKPVFNQEYAASGGGGSVSEQDYINAACPYFQSQQISSLWKRGLNLDGQGVTICAP